MEQEVIVTEEDFKDPVLFQIGYLNQFPHKKQMEVLRSPQKNKIIVCGRRSGKTQMIAGEIIRGAILNLYPKQTVIGPQYKHVLIVFNKIIELMKRAKVFEDIKKVVQSPYPKIIFGNNAFVDFGSADNPDSLRGEGYDRQFKDESAFIKPGAKHAIKPQMYDTGGPIWETTTPWGKGEVWELWERGLKGDTDYGCFHYNYKDNPYLADEGIKEIEKDIKEWGESSIYVQCEIYGNFVEDRDAYFSRELIRKCIDESYEVGGAPHPKSIFVLGVDFARMGQDSSVFFVVEETMKKEIRVIFIEETKQKLITDAIGRVKIMNEKYNFMKMYLDETGLGAGPTDVLGEHFGSGMVEGMTFTIKSKQDLYSNLKKMMEQGKIKFPNNRKLIYQLMDLRYEIASSGDLKIHHSEKGHDDYCDSLALACMYWKETSQEFYEPFIC